MVVVGCSTSIFTKIMHSQCKKAVLIQWNKHLCGWGSHPPEVLYFIFEVKSPRNASCSRSFIEFVNKEQLTFGVLKTRIHDRCNIYIYYICKTTVILHVWTKFWVNNTPCVDRWMHRVNRNESQRNKFERDELQDYY